MTDFVSQALAESRLRARPSGGIDSESESETDGEVSGFLVCAPVAAVLFNGGRRSAALGVCLAGSCGSDSESVSDIPPWAAWVFLIAVAGGLALELPMGSITGEVVVLLTAGRG